MGSTNGTVTWAARRSVGIPLGLLIYGVVLSMLAAPGLVVMNNVHPEAMPFAWLALIVVLLLSLGHARRNGVDNDIIEKMEGLNKTEKVQYLMNIMFIVSGMMTFHIVGTAAIAAFTGFYLGYPVIGILFAIIYPRIDAYLGRNINTSLGTLGLYISISLLRVLSLISGSPVETTEAAARDAKSVI